MKILNDLDIHPKNIELYERAFVHNSYANEENVFSYERLEFLGDTVLDVIVSEYLFNQGKYNEGEMTKIRAAFVCEKALYEYSIKLGLNNYLKLGHGEENSGGKTREPIVADIFESFIGAIYLDQGIDKVKEVIFKVVIPFIEEDFNKFFSDYKSILQEYVQSDDYSVEYRLINEEGPSHDKLFTVEVFVEGISYGIGVGGSKKEAEQKAAKNALDKRASL